MVVGVTAMAVVGLGAIDAYRQTRIRDVVGAGDDQATALARGNVSQVRAIAQIVPDIDDPRAQVAEALILARGAIVAPDTAQRQHLLDRADALLGKAQAQRTDWADALVAASFVASLRGNPQGRTAALRSLAASYQAAPFSRDAGLWRVREGLSAWDRSTPDLHRHVIEEAIWLARLDGRLRTEIFGLVRGSSAYSTFARRWLALRRLDADWRPVSDRTAP